MIEFGESDAILNIASLTSYSDRNDCVVARIRSTDSAVYPTAMYSVNRLNRPILSDNSNTLIERTAPVSQLQQRPG